eukprot:7153359-Pyramimonas_sp.AAC.1
MSSSLGLVEAAGGLNCQKRQNGPATALALRHGTINGNGPWLMPRAVIMASAYWRAQCRKS